nr:endoglucanase 1-like [Tanacetum cinerariifolium]
MVTSESLIVQAKKQIDYILGDNLMKMSYMVGFSDKYPKRIHHRGSSVPSIYDHPNRISCDDGHQFFNSGSPNPNLLVGAIVGGPDSNDNYGDDRGDMSPGITQSEKLEGDTFSDDLPECHLRAHIVSVKQLSATVEGFPGRHVAWDCACYNNTN